MLVVFIYVHTYMYVQSLPGKLHSGRAFETGCNCVLDESNSESPSLPYRCTCSVSMYNMYLQHTCDLMRTSYLHRPQGYLLNTIL